MRLDEKFVHLRGSKGFLVGILTFLCCAVILHYVIGLDPEWGGLNTILSAEASIALAFFTMVSDRQEAHQKKQLEYMLHVMQAIKTLLEKDDEPRS